MRLFWIQAMLVAAVFNSTLGWAHRDSLERNKTIARMVFEDVLNHGKWDVYERIHAPDFVAHVGKRTEGRAEDLESAKGWRNAMPDLVVTIDHMVAEGDLVADGSNRRIQFHKRRQLFPRVHNKALTVASMRVSNPDRAPAIIHG